MFGVNDLCSRHKDRGTEVGTDIECVWDKPRTQSTLMEIDDIDIRNDTRTPKKVTPTHPNYKSTVKNLNSEEIKLKLKQICKGSNGMLFQTLYDDGDDIEGEIFDVPIVLDVANSEPDNIFDALRSVFDKETIRKIETITKDQSENPEWYNQPKGRVTASTFSSILSFRFTENDENYISKRVMGSSSVVDVPSVKFGKENKNVARQLCFLNYKMCHEKDNLDPSGLHVDEIYPF